MATANEVISCRAAVAWAPKQELSIETIEVAPPKAGEVRIKVLFNALCHTDVYTLDGHDAEGKFPCVLGHEGAGIVESVGEGVNSVAIGDLVIPCYVPQCRECQFCKHPRTNLCQKVRETQGKGVMPDGSTRFRCKGQEIFHFMGTSTFAEYTVVSEFSCVKVNASANPEKICLLGCGVSTGYGAALNTAQVEKGSTCAVWGLGAVGLAAIMGCAAAGATRIIGIDINEDKFEQARNFGATHVVNPLKLTDQSLQQFLFDSFDGGPDYTFECVGNVATMRAALECAHKGWGVSVIIGVAAAGQEISTRPFQLVTGRSWKGTAFGGWKSRDDIPKLVDQYLQGTFKIDGFHSHSRSLAQVNEAIDLLRKGESIRCVVKLHATDS